LYQGCNNIALSSQRCLDEEKGVRHMITAVVLVNTEFDSQNKVIENLRKVEGVQEAHQVYGVYDLFVKIKANSIERLKEIIQLNIRRLEGVTNSLTLMVVPS
jgi:DNA-binding Lrp family transcriptional regulator